MTKPAALPDPRSNLVVLHFPEALPKFTFADRATLFDETVRLRAGLGLATCLYDETDLGEFATFVMKDGCSASWCLARQRGGLLLWNAQTGVDVGEFHTMHDVLQQIEALSVSPDMFHVKLFGVGRAAKTSDVVCLKSFRALRLEQARVAKEAQQHTWLNEAM